MKTIKGLATGLMLISALWGCGDKAGSNGSNTDSTGVANLEPKVVGHEVSYQSGDITLKGYIAYDENVKEKRPGILVVHEWWGHNGYSRSRAEKLAALGYVALALDMYGDGKQASHPEDAGAFAGAVMGNIKEAEGRFSAGLNQLKMDSHVDGSKIAAVGYCFGGSVAMTMANMGMDLKGVAAFHSGITLPEMPKEGTPVKARMLICQGADDPFLDSTDVASFKSEMDKAGVRYEYITYPGAMHAFTNPDADSLGKKFELPLRYDWKADEESWEALRHFLTDIFS
jgi:dienelactone hydrolase